MNSSKINIIVNWLILINVKDIQSFLDFANFYKRFIYDYSRIVIWLTRLIRKDVLFVWFQKCQIAFNILKKVFTFKIILRHYNSDHKIVIEIDVSNYVFKDILFQYNENEILYSITYFLKKHNSIKYNYEIYDKELMIIVYAFKKWWSEFKDFIYSVKMIMNHKNLEYFMSIKQLSCHQARWSEFLSKLNYCIAYHFNKIDDKLNALTHHSEDFFKKRDTFDSRHQYQHQTILKTHVLDLNIVENLALDVFVSFSSLMIVSLMIIQKEQKVMNWSVESTDDQTFISMFNALYETVTCAHVSNSLNNKLKNDCVFFQFSNIIDVMFSWTM